MIRMMHFVVSSLGRRYPVFVQGSTRPLVTKCVSPVFFNHGTPVEIRRGGVCVVKGFVENDGHDDRNVFSGLGAIAPLSKWWEGDPDTILALLPEWLYDGDIVSVVGVSAATVRGQVELFPEEWGLRRR